MVLPPVVVRELDQHKNVHPSDKIRKRARRIASKLDEIFETDTRAKIREGVEILIQVEEPSIDFSAHKLRIDWKDDQLLASIIEFREQHSQCEVVLITADLLLKQKARHHEIATLKLSDQFKLPEEPGPSEKLIKELEEEIRRYQTRLPKLRASFTDSSEQTLLRLRLRAPIQLSEAYIHQRLEMTKLEHPKISMPSEKPPSQKPPSQSGYDVGKEEGHIIRIRPNTIYPPGAI